MRTTRWPWTRPAACFSDRIDYAETPEDALEGADALLVVTEWKAFPLAGLRRASSRQLKQALVFDGRNLYEPVANAAAGH